MAAITYKCPNCGGGLSLSRKRRSINVNTACQGLCRRIWKGRLLGKTEEKRQKPVKKRRLWRTAGTLRQGGRRLFLSELRGRGCDRSDDGGDLLLLLP